MKQLHPLFRDLDSLSLVVLIVSFESQRVGIHDELGDFFRKDRIRNVPEVSLIADASFRKRVWEIVFNLWALGQDWIHSLHRDFIVLCYFDRLDIRFGEELLIPTKDSLHIVFGNTLFGQKILLL